MGAIWAPTTGSGAEPQPQTKFGGFWLKYDRTWQLDCKFSLQKFFFCTGRSGPGPWSFSLTSLMDDPAMATTRINEEYYSEWRRICAINYRYIVLPELHYYVVFFPYLLDNKSYIKLYNTLTCQDVVDLPSFWFFVNLTLNLLPYNLW